MALDFPSSPTIGQTYGTYTWDGEKWYSTIGGVGCVSSASVTFLARTTGLDTTHTNAYTALIDGLVTDGLWSKFDVLYITATQDTTTAQLNLVSTSYPATLHGSPTFTADRGYTGVDGSATVYISTAFIANTASSPKYVQNSAHISAWSVTNAANSSSGPIGVSSGANAYFIPKYTDSVTFYCRINSNALNGASVSNAQGHFIDNRSSSSATQSYRNGGSVGSFPSDTSLGIPDKEMYVLSVNISAVPTGSPHQVAMASIGSSLDATQAANFYSRLRTYMTAVGVP